MKNVFLQKVNEMGRILDEKRSEYQKDSEFFSHQAESLLKDFACYQDFDFEQIVDWYLKDPCLPIQSDSTSFAEPYINLYKGVYFHIGILVWHESAPGIHNHEFSGAWEVVQGKTYHYQFQFNEEEALSSTLFLGQLTPLNSEILPPGAVRPIVAGKSFIHRTDYLVKPTISLIVRTDQNDFNLNFQRLYDPWQVAYSSSTSNSPKLTRLFQLLRYFEKGNPKEIHQFSRDAVGTLTLFEAYRFAKMYNNYLSLEEAISGDKLKELVSLFPLKKAEWVNAICQAIQNSRFQIVNQFLFKKESHRLIYSTLLSRPSKQIFIEQMRKFFPKHETSIPSYLAKQIYEITQHFHFPFALDKLERGIIEAHLAIKTNSQNEAWNWAQQQLPIWKNKKQSESNALYQQMSAVECLGSVFDLPLSRG